MERRKGDDPGVGLPSPLAPAGMVSGFYTFATLDPDTENPVPWYSPDPETPGGPLHMRTQDTGGILPMLWGFDSPAGPADTLTVRLRAVIDATSPTSFPYAMTFSNPLDSTTYALTGATVTVVDAPLGASGLGATLIPLGGGGMGAMLTIDPSSPLGVYDLIIELSVDDPIPSGELVSGFYGNGGTVVDGHNVRIPWWRWS